MVGLLSISCLVFDCVGLALHWSVLCYELVSFVVVLLFLVVDVMLEQVGS